MNKYRANRKNYIVANITIILLAVAGVLLSGLVSQLARDQGGVNVLVGLFTLLFALYIFLIWARIVILRSRDFNLPGWAGFLLAFFLSPAALIFAFIPGTEGDNEYGPRPTSDVSLRAIFLK